MDNIAISRMNRLESGVFSIRMILMLVVFCILCVSLAAIMSAPVGAGCGTPGCPCHVRCECANGYCACMKRHNALELEQFANVTSKEDNESFRSGVKYDTRQAFVTRKFEMVAQNNSLNAPKNLLAGQGEFIFDKDTVYVTVLANVYTIGANIFAAKDQDFSKLHYNVYLGDSTKALKGKLGELKRSLDGLYKLVLESKSREFIEFIAQNEYIVVKLEDDDKTVRLNLLESFY